MSKRAMRAVQFGVLAFLAVVAAERMFVHPHNAPGPHGKAPALALLDLSGRTVDLASYRGKAVAVNFWASWCEPCKAEIPALVEVHKAHAGDCFEMLGVAVESGGAADVAQFARAHKMGYPILQADDATLDRWDFGGLLPTTFLVDPRGNIAFSHTGALTRGELEKELKPLIPARAGC